jgi:uncharacterized membrane protein
VQSAFGCKGDARHRGWARLPGHAAVTAGPDHAIGTLVDVSGVAVIAVGTLPVSLRAVQDVRTRPPLPDVYRGFRQRLGRVVLVGLELLVAADIIRTVAVVPTLESVAVLGVIVLVRTFLSFSLEVELGGRWPWQRVAVDRGSP